MSIFQKMMPIKLFQFYVATITARKVYACGVTLQFWKKRLRLNFCRLKSMNNAPLCCHDFICHTYYPIFLKGTSGEANELTILAVLIMTMQNFLLLCSKVLKGSTHCLFLIEWFFFIFLKIEPILKSSVLMQY